MLDAGIDERTHAFDRAPVHPQIDQRDQSAALGDGNKLRRRHHRSQALVFPSDQSFHAGDPPRPEVQLRLIDEGE